MKWLLAASLAAGVSALAWWRRRLTMDGALAATVVGTLTFARGGLPAAAAMLAFFVSSSALSRSGQQVKGARRDAWQVLANGGVSTLAIAFGWREAFLGALATAAADTWATEIGMRSSRDPRSITTLRRVPRGTSGGVSLPGLVASAGGALTVGLAWSLAGGSFAWRGVLVGFAGSLVDSLLGATVQAVYRCPRCDARIEAPVHALCGTSATLVQGLPAMTNDAVNALSTGAGAALGHLSRG